MSKKIALVGHCGPDASYLMVHIRRAIDGAHVSLVDDAQELDELLNAGVDLVLFNRELHYGFEESMGVDVIKRLSETHPQVKTMLISNYAEAHDAAVAAGALRGFGKRELGTPRVAELLQSALE